MKIQVNDKTGFRADGMKPETVSSRVAKIKAYAASKTIEVVSGSFWGLEQKPTTDRERLIETAVNRIASGERLSQEEIDA